MIKTLETMDENRLIDMILWLEWAKTEDPELKTLKIHDAAAQPKRVPRGTTYILLTSPYASPQNTIKTLQKEFELFRSNMYVNENGKMNTNDNS
jgi:hypothetical protein